MHFGAYSQKTCKPFSIQHMQCTQFNYKKSERIVNDGEQNQLDNCHFFQTAGTKSCRFPKSFPQADNSTVLTRGMKQTVRFLSFSTIRYNLNIHLLGRQQMARKWKSFFSSRRKLELTTKVSSPFEPNRKCSPRSQQNWRCLVFNSFIWRNKTSSGVSVKYEKDMTATWMLVFDNNSYLYSLRRYKSRKIIHCVEILLQEKKLL